MALVCCVDESVPYEKKCWNTTHGRIGTRTAGAVDWVFRASDAFAKKIVYRGAYYTVTCMCELWIILLVFPMQQIVGGSDMMTRVQTA